MHKIDDLYTFIVSDYYATGEGRTVSLLITRAYPRTDDYEEQPETIYTEGKYHFNPGVMKNGPAFRALREFAEKFDGFYARGAEVLTWENFNKRYGTYLPPFTEKIMTAEDGPGNFNLHLQLHMNFS